MQSPSTPRIAASPPCIADERLIALMLAQRLRTDAAFWAFMARVLATVVEVSE